MAQVRLEANRQVIDEDGGQVSVVVTAFGDRGSGIPSGTPMEVNVTGSENPNAVDLAPVESFTVPVNTSHPQPRTFDLIPENDDVDEQDETISIAGTADTGVTVIGTRDTSRVPVEAVLDGAERYAEIVFITGQAHFGEDGGAWPVTLIVRLSHTFADPVSVTLSINGSGEPDAVDFTPVPDIDIVIPPGTPQSEVVSFTVIPDDDAVKELDEVITVSGTSDVPVLAGSLHLLDDDTSSTTVVLSSVPTEVGEGDGATEVVVTATLDEAARVSPTTVRVDTNYGTRDKRPRQVDYRLTEGVYGVLDDQFTITIAAEAPSGTATFTLEPVDDDVDEKNALLRMWGSPNEFGISSQEATVTVVDDDEPSMRIALTSNPNEVDEGGGAAEVVLTATLDKAARTLSTEVAVSIAGSGNPGVVDFAPVAPFKFMIAADAPSGTGTFTLTPEDDAVDEANETLTVSGAADLPVDSAAEVVLTDDDEPSTRITLTTDPAVVSEGSVATSVAVTATLNAGARLRPTEVVVGVTGDLDPDAVDFDPVPSFTITIAAEAASGTGAFTLSPEDDAVDEAHETLTVAGTADLPVDSATVKLEDDDETSMRVVLTVDPAAVSEGSGATAVAVTAALDKAARTVPTEVTVSIAESGDPGVVDFAPVASFTITIAAQAPSATVSFTLTPEDDAVDEANETLTLSGSSDLPVDPAQVLLTDDDETSKRITLTADPTEVEEDGGAVSVTVTAMLDLSTRTVPTEVVVGVAGSGDPGVVDFAPVASFTITIAAQAPSATVSFTLTPEDDAVDEANETLTLSGSSDLPVDPAQVSLTDDDETSTRITLTADPTEVEEDGGAVSVTVTAMLDLSTRTGPTEVVVGVAGSGDPAAVDFAPVASFTITIAAEAASGTGTFTLTPEDDAVDETNETLTVSGSADLPVAPAQVSLTDDDETSTGIALTTDPAVVSEGSVATPVAVTATLDKGARTVPTEVVVGVTGHLDPDAVDFDPVPSFTITIAAEAASGTATFTLTPEDDAVDEADETLTLTGSSDLPVAPAQVSLTDDDETSTDIALTVDPAAVSEGSGATAVAVTATLDAAARTGPTEVVVGVAGSGEPTAVDFDPVASFTITIAAEAPGGTVSFTLTPEDDAVDEADETLTLTGSSDLPVAPAQVSLTDDDETSTEITLTVAPTSVGEGDGAAAVAVTATLDAAARTGPTEVVVGVAGSGDPTAVDFAPVASFTITIAAQAPDGTATFTLTPEDDAVDEMDETLTVSGSADLAVISTEVQLTDDDETSTEITLTAAPAGVGEGDGAAAVTVTAMLDAAARTGPTEVVVGVAGSGDPAAVDFAPVASFTITIAAESPDGTGTFTLTPEDDAVDEMDETLTLSGSAELAVISAEVLLTDDDETSTEITLTAFPAGVGEGDGAAAVTVTATLDAAARTGPTEVVVGVAGSGDPAAVDFDPVASFTITIAAESPDGTGTFTLTPEDDAVDEADETLTLTGSADLPVAPAQVSLTDDDETSTDIALTVDPVAVSEGSGATAVAVTATLDAAARTGPTEVVVGVAGSGEPTAVDFDPVASFTITIAAEAPGGTVSFTLTPEDDAVDEANETLTLTGSSDLPVAPAQVSLTDDDETSTEITLTAAPTSVGEGDGAAAVAVTATLDAAARTGPTEVVVGVAGSGEPTAVDFDPVASFTITIAAQAPDGAFTFTLTPEDDAVDEADETLTVSGSADLPVDSAQVSLTDDDETSTEITLTAAPAGVGEGDGAAAVTVTATLDAAARTGPTEVVVGVAGSGDPAAVDFDPVASFTITIAAESPDGTGTFTLMPEDDAVDETNETLTVSGSADLAVISVEVQLTDDDETSTEITLTAVPAGVGEGDGAAAVTVTATLDAAARTGPTEVVVGVAGSGDPAAVDFDPVASFTITIAAESPDGTGTFTLMPEDDAVDEMDETLTVSGSADLAVISAEVQLTDDDETSMEITLTAVPVGVGEGDGAAAVTVTATLDAAARTGPTEVVVGVAGSGDPAAVDFDPVASFTITIATESPDGTATFTLTPEDDAVDEADETLTLTGSADLPVAPAQVSLTDDDETSTGIALTVDPGVVSEGSGGTAVAVTATLDAAARTGPTEVVVGVAGSGDPTAVDFAPVASFTITIAAGAPGGTVSFTLTPEDDAVDEADETLTVSGSADLPVDSAQVSLTDDDETSTEITLTAAPAAVSEGSGGTEVTVTATLDAAARTSATEVVVGVAGSGEPTAVDFATVASFTITIAAQAPDGTATFTLTPEDDAVDETDETLTLSARRT